MKPLKKYLNPKSQWNSSSIYTINPEIELQDFMKLLSKNKFYIQELNLDMSFTYDKYVSYLSNIIESYSGEKLCMYFPNDARMNICKCNTHYYNTVMFDVYFNYHGKQTLKKAYINDYKNSKYSEFKSSKDFPEFFNIFSDTFKIHE